MLDNSPEFRADSKRKWLTRLDVNTSYFESFNGKFQNELLNGEIFDNMFEEKVTSGNNITIKKAPLVR